MAVLGSNDQVALVLRDGALPADLGIDQVGKQVGDRTLAAALFAADAENRGGALGGKSIQPMP
ncbi:hypothetical protein FF124_19805 [Martelella lutilitoris]|uniref:Uncharacterized protein n=1 Tax=Martelella lutilitoris TaxID=2583532 RepID=A0A5C4JLC7_9HYPH|nr:hypothetical protein [Martelella lutilitoris]TNB46150.1 hypothetical protein FF124_19805 [Martelella lutilitoris]